MKIIAFEGIDGSGKSYQIRLLSQWLSNNFIDYKLVGDLSSTEVGRFLSSLIIDRHSQYKLTNVELAFLFTVARSHSFSPYIESEMFILKDRYLASTYSYLLYKQPNCSELFNIISSMTKPPSLTIFIDTPVSKCLTRISKRSVSDRFDREANEESLNIKREAYLDYASFCKEPFITLDGSKSAEYLHEEIVKVYKEHCCSNICNECNTIGK